ncbi:hypothetical protein AB0C59_31880 [Streptomyces sp. NPDC048664]|uniref:SCO4983 family protein n=1 Tax=Streptomyces sp. NPDC048664 TaxID=3154505 RepID=UPI00343CBC37
MYEAIRTKSVHSMAGTTPAFPHRSREEELDIQLAGHLVALLAVTDELRALEPTEDLDEAARRLAGQVARLREGSALPEPKDAPPTRTAPAGPAAPLHRRAHALASRALLVAASRADTAVAILAAQRMDAHSAAPADPREPAAAG